VPVYFGAKVLILDEPTSALGVKQSGQGAQADRGDARDRGLGVIFITHNPHHAYPVGDEFVLLNRGHSMGNFAKAEISPRRAHAADGRRRRARGQLAHELEAAGAIRHEDLTTPD
jgi:simple sugar transport system ATP-binding protein